MSSRDSRSSIVLVAMSLAVASAGCESALVGADCRAPLVRCGHFCVDLESDQLNCGVCGNACGLACVSGVCAMGDAGPMIDASHWDGGHDGGRDAGDDAGSDVGTDAFAPHDVGTDTGLNDGGGPRCGLGLMLCGATCVDPNDGAHCGDCTTVCSGSEVCAGGACMPDCGARMACGTSCVDPTIDARHCGDCTTDCGSGICSASACTTAPAGHVVVIGHDYETRRIEMSTILANAVLLPARSPTRVLGYQGSATTAAIAGTEGALTEAATAGSYVLTSATDADEVPALLDDADTFLVYAQAGASDETIRTLGYVWTDALDEFLEQGGVVVVLDAPSLSNGGTFQLLDVAGLFHAASASEIVSPRLVAASGRESDPVVAGVLFPYSGERHTVRLSTLDPDVVVTTGAQPVVIHRVITH